MKNNSVKDMENFIYEKYPHLKRPVSMGYGIVSIITAAFAIFIGLGLYDFMPGVETTIMPGFAIILRGAFALISFIPAQFILLFSFAVLFLTGRGLGNISNIFTQTTFDIISGRNPTVLLVAFIICCAVVVALTVVSLIMAIKQRKIIKNSLSKSASILSLVNLGLSAASIIVSIILTVVFCAM